MTDISNLNEESKKEIQNIYDGFLNKARALYTVLNEKHVLNIPDISWNNLSTSDKDEWVRTWLRVRKSRGNIDNKNTKIESPRAVDTTKKPKRIKKN